MVTSCFDRGYEVPGRPKGRDDVLSSLNTVIEALNTWEDNLRYRAGQLARIWLRRRLLTVVGAHPLP